MTDLYNQAHFKGSIAINAQGPTEEKNIEEWALIAILSRSLFRQHCKQGFWNMGTRFFTARLIPRNLMTFFVFVFKITSFSIHEKITIA